ncbi:sensor domain-containing diguanylate cyclase [Luteimonas saliphila]|uniref:sensor domain-containing diguanylate cyclase n=1 Tax=Luteimonas saliphila TaxID=2804919 RepID=UPI00192D3583|nr:diguanylate cyclase [Luteimonas saliphila]
MGDPWRPRWRRSLGLCFLLLWSTALGAVELTVRELRDDPPAAEVLGGQHDANLQPPRERATIQQTARETQWWRIDAAAPVAADTSPKLVLRSPFLYRVEAWVPGADAPTRHALYGAHADDRYSARALVVDLPAGIPAGDPVWLRIEHRSTMLTAVSVETLDDVHRQDLGHVAWRSLVLTSLAVLVILALAFWGGTGERSYGYFGAMLLCAVGYLAAIGGDLRWLPWADMVFGTSAQTNRLFGCTGIVFSNLFQRSYLDLPRKLPWLDRLLGVGTAVAAVSAVCTLFGDWPVFSMAGNFALLYSAVVLVVASGVLSIGGDRVARVVLASWIWLCAFSFMAAAQMLGLWSGPAWLGQGLAGSFVIASLLLAIGLLDKLLQLRRDRDHANRQAVIDPVTKAMNRQGIEERLYREVEDAREQGAPLSIAFIDVDRFKEINDRHGHSVGDQCLRIVSWRLRNQLRRNEAIGRYGGDEFLVVLPGRRQDEALSIAERMRISVNCRPLSMAELELLATLSIGVAELEPGESMASLFERADAALYASKSAGRDRASAAAPQEGLWTV